MKKAKVIISMDNLHFRMTDADGLKYRKLAGTLIVKRATQG